MKAVGQRVTVLDWGCCGGRLLGLCGPEVEGFTKRGGHRTNQLGPRIGPQARHRRPKKGESERPQIRKTTTAGVHATAASDQGNGGGAMPRGREKAPLKCKFAELTGCTCSHPPLLCKAFGDKHLRKGAGSSRTTSCAPFACYTVQRRFAIQKPTRQSRSAQNRNARSSTSSGCMMY
jgi:hypothetical protein